MTDSQKTSTTSSSNRSESTTSFVTDKFSTQEQNEDLSKVDESLFPSTKTINRKTTPQTNANNRRQNKQQQSPLHPFVHWAQTQTHISLRVDLIQVENLEVDITDTGSALNFSAQGRGAHGLLQDYHFSLEFYSTVNKKIDCLTIERYVLILIKKIDIQIDNWPRLTKQQLKFPWLRVDFDRYHADDSDDSLDNNHEANDGDFLRGKQSYEHLRQQLDEARQQQQQSEEEFDSQKWKSGNSWCNSLSNILKSKIDNLNPPFFSKSSTNSSAKMKHDYRKVENVAMDNSRNIARHALDAKKTYLFLYNLVMFIMFLKVYIVLLIKGFSGTVDDDIVQGAAFIIKILTYTQLLESIHPVLGLVPGGFLMPFTQVVGRLLVNHFLTEPEIRLNSAPYAHYLFVVWTSIEIFRYSFYALRVFKVDIYALTWCRYTLFLPLYPMGGFCESMVVFSTINFYEKTGDYSIALPNAANFSFNLPLALRIYTFLILGPTIYSLMKYMWKQRCRQLKEKAA